MRTVATLLFAATVLAGCAAAPGPAATDKAAALGYHGPAWQTQRAGE